MKKITRKLIPYSIRVRLHRPISIFYKFLNYCRYTKVKFFNKSEIYFEYNKEKYQYYIALHNTTFLNERTVEIPIILGYIKKFEKKAILEIGNVISHYEKISYDVLDKYEKGKDIINSDIIDYKPKKTYDLIVSISTFEHIGFDEVTRYGENKNILVHQSILSDAIKNTKNLLKENGLFIFTAPLGFNNFLDSQLIDNKLGLTEAHFLKRISLNNKWIQVGYQDIVGAKYNDPYSCANGLLIGIYYKSGKQQAV